MIHKQSSSAQFVTTTFRAELLKDADRHFGVFYRGKASQVKPYIIGGGGRGASFNYLGDGCGERRGKGLCRTGVEKICN